MADQQQCDCQLKNWSNVLAEDKLSCKVLFFAAAAEAVGEREQTITVGIGSTVADVFDHFASMHTALTSLQQTCAFAIDEKLVHIDTEVTDGCTMAVLPPVSGG